MEIRPELVCNQETCGRSFPTIGALNFHKRSCGPSRKRLQSALSKGKELWEIKKRARTMARDAKEAASSMPEASSVNSSNLGSLSSANPQAVHNPWVRSPCSTVSLPVIEVPALQNESEPVTHVSDLDLPLSNRRGRRENRRPPAKFRDNMPQPQPSGMFRALRSSHRLF